VVVCITNADRTERDIEYGQCVDGKDERSVGES